MDASHELDALVAEKVMGAEWDADGYLRSPDGEGWAWAHRPGDGEFWAAPGPAGLPRYSTSIATAFLVVEKIQDYCCDLTIEKAGAEWHVDFRTGMGSGATLPLAICRAALAAHEVPHA